MPLIAVVGGLGSGKTIKLVERAIFYRRHDYNVYANFELNDIKYTFLEEPLEILRIQTPRNVVLGDEFYHWFDCYESAPEVKKAMRNIINASRKKDQIIICSTQTLGQLSLKYRDIIDAVYVPQYLPSIDMLVSKVSVIPTVAGYGYRLQDLITEKITNISTLFPYYDTNEILDGFFDFDGSKYNSIRNKGEKTFNPVGILDMLDTGITDKLKV